PGLLQVPGPRRHVRLLLPAERVLMATARVALIVPVLLSACAPTISITRAYDEVVRNESVLGEGHDRLVRVTVPEPDNGAALKFTASETCSEQPVRIVHRRKVDERHASLGGQVAFYLLSAAGLGLGAGTVGDAHNVPEASDPTMRNPVGRTGAYAVGG